MNSEEGMLLSEFRSRLSEAVEIRVLVGLFIGMSVVMIRELTFTALVYARAISSGSGSAEVLVSFRKTGICSVTDEMWRSL